RRSGQRRRSRRPDRRGPPRLSTRDRARPQQRHRVPGLRHVLPSQQSLAQEQEAVRLDPRNASAQNNLVVDHLDLGEYPQALAPVQALITLDPHSADNALLLALTCALLHRNADAVKAFDLAQPDTGL